MNKKSALFSVAWVLTCGTAFLVGKTSSETKETASASQAASSTINSRSTARGSSSERQERKQNRRGGSRSTEKPSEAQLEELADQVRDLKNLSDPIARAEGFLALVRDLGPDEFQAAVAAYREGGINNEQFGEYSILLTAWAQVDPLNALDYASENTGTPYARKTILAAWAKTNTEAAVAWANENFDNRGDENRANPWIVGVIEGIATTDLGRATQLLEELPFSRDRGTALDAIFKAVSATGNEDTKLWISQLTDPQLKQGAASRLAGELAKEDPQSAAEWAATLGDEVLTRSAATIVNQWAETDLNAARDWVGAQSTEVIAASGPNLVQQMIQDEDIATASTWLGNFEGNPAFDSSIKSLVRYSLTDSPTVAADWIMKLTSEQDQERTFHRVLGNWMRQDREGAIDYINNNPTPESITRRAGATQ